MDGWTCRTFLRLAVLASWVFLATSVTVSAQLSLPDAEKISAETGRTLFVVAGRKT